MNNINVIRKKSCLTLLHVLALTTVVTVVFSSSSTLVTAQTPTSGTSIPPTQPQNAAEYLKRGLGYYDAQKYQQAFDDFSQVIRLDPNNFRGYFYRSLMYQALNNPDAALKDIQQAIFLNPKSSHAYTVRASLTRQTNPQAAMADLERSLQLDNTQPTTYTVRSQLKEQLGDREGALADLQQAANLARSQNLDSLLTLITQDIQRLQSATTSSSIGTTPPNPSKPQENTPATTLPADRYRVVGLGDRIGENFYWGMTWNEFVEAVQNRPQPKNARGLSGLIAPVRLVPINAQPEKGYAETVTTQYLVPTLPWCVKKNCGRIDVRFEFTNQRLTRIVILRKAPIGSVSPILSHYQENLGLKFGPEVNIEKRPGWSYDYLQGLLQSPEGEGRTLLRYYGQLTITQLVYQSGPRRGQFAGERRNSLVLLELLPPYATNAPLVRANDIGDFQVP